MRDEREKAVVKVEDVVEIGKSARRNRIGGK